MTAEQALKLIESGFEVDEIRAFMQSAGAGEEKGVSGSDNQGSTGSEEQGASGSTGSEEQQPSGNETAQNANINVEAIAKEIAGLKDLIQAGNTRKDNGQAKLQTVEDILAKFINPTGGKENE